MATESAPGVERATWSENGIGTATATGHGMAKAIRTLISTEIETRNENEKASETRTLIVTLLDNRDPSEASCSPTAISNVI